MRWAVRSRSDSFRLPARRRHRPRSRSATAGDVVLARLPEGGPAGASTRERDAQFILVNSRAPVVRRRFTLAHEYGHHCLGHGAAYDERIWWGASDPREAAANGFAGESPGVR